MLDTVRLIALAATIVGGVAIFVSFVAVPMIYQEVQDVWLELDTEIAEFKALTDVTWEHMMAMSFEAGGRHPRSPQGAGVAYTSFNPGPAGVAIPAPQTVHVAVPISAAAASAAATAAPLGQVAGRNATATLTAGVQSGTLPGVVSVASAAANQSASTSTAAAAAQAGLGGSANLTKVAAAAATAVPKQAPEAASSAAPLPAPGPTQAPWVPLPQIKSALSAFQAESGSVKSFGTCNCNAHSKCPAGPPGPPGPPGDDGHPGFDGVPGAEGSTATDVRNELNATKCITCPGGERGPKGARGPAGPTGKSGSPGLTGSPGRGSPSGPLGAPGSKGDPGPDGRQGPIGRPGRDGENGKGKPGPKGERGVQGPEGPQGLDGKTANQTAKAGIPGPPGLPGIKGNDGPPGDQGPRGPPGAVGNDGGYCACPGKEKVGPGSGPGAQNAAVLPDAQLDAAVRTQASPDSLLSISGKSIVSSNIDLSNSLQPSDDFAKLSSGGRGKLLEDLAAPRSVANAPAAPSPAKPPGAIAKPASSGQAPGPHGGSANIFPVAGSGVLLDLLDAKTT